jgi:hypothetical protein
MNVDPELRKRVEQIKSSPVQLYREAGDYSNRELVEGIVVSPDDIAAIEAVARDEALDVERLARAICATRPPPIPEDLPHHVDDECRATASLVAAEYTRPVIDDPTDAAHHRMVQPDHYQRWER